MSHTMRRPKREPAERPFRYRPRAVPVTVQPADVAPHVPTRQRDPWAAYADVAMTGWTTR
jgi:hypothetical protein